jgi:hypothetical protein
MMLSARFAIANQKVPLERKQHFRAGFSSKPDEVLHIKKDIPKEARVGKSS